MRTGLLLLSLLSVPLSACAKPRAPETPASAQAAAEPAACHPCDAPAGDAPAAEPGAGDLSAPPDVAAPPADSKKTASGLAYKVLRPGTGTQHPTAADNVRVHYTGWTTDGKMFDSSLQRGEPATFPLGAVIKGWTEGVQLMVVGEKTRFWIPAALAYGDTPKENAPTGMLVFDVELLGIE